MDTPVCDFVERYRSSEPVRMHMPGHKGRAFAGPEAVDITEISGADVLYHSEGIIRRSEENAARLFGAGRTVYSAEGSSLCIRAMLLLAVKLAAEEGRPARILAGRNAHRTLMTSAAMLDLETDWIYPSGDEGLLTCTITPERLEEALGKKSYAAVFITSPDYLGGMTDTAALAEVCHRHGTPLLADNAHGAYLKFIEGGRHPMDQGADMCCDSAHKTLGCLTGAAYLHISASAPALFAREAEQAMGMFASTSPSYLILQSLDRMNRELAEGYAGRIAAAADRAGRFRDGLAGAGWLLAGNEPMKITVAPKSMGYTGTELGDILREYGIEPEFADPDYLTLMPSAETTESDWVRLEEAFGGIRAKEPILERPPAPGRPVRAMSIRRALLGAGEEIAAEDACGRVIADAYVGCPPAVPIITAGETADENTVRCFRYYGVKTCFAVKNKSCKGAGVLI